MKKTTSYGSTSWEDVEAGDEEAKATSQNMEENLIWAGTAAARKNDFSIRIDAPANRFSVPYSGGCDFLDGSGWRVVVTATRATDGKMCQIVDVRGQFWDPDGESMVGNAHFCVSPGKVGTGEEEEYEDFYEDFEDFEEPTDDVVNAMCDNDWNFDPSDLYPDGWVDKENRFQKKHSLDAFLIFGGGHRCYDQYKNEELGKEDAQAEAAKKKSDTTYEDYYYGNDYTRTLSGIDIKFFEPRDIRNGDEEGYLLSQDAEEQWLISRLAAFKWF